MLVFRNTLIQLTYLSNTFFKSLSFPYQQHRNRSSRRRCFGQHCEWIGQSCKALLREGRTQLLSREDEICPGRSTRRVWHSWNIWTITLYTVTRPKQMYSNSPRTAMRSIEQRTSWIKMICLEVFSMFTLPAILQALSTSTCHVAVHVFCTRSSLLS